MHHSQRPCTQLSRSLRAVHGAARKTLTACCNTAPAEPAPAASPVSHADDDFLCFAPDFDASPDTGQLRTDWLPAHSAGVPAGAGKPDRVGFKLWQQRVSVQGRELVLVGPANLDSVTFWYWRQGRRDMDPFWARPWPSGLALADLILRRPELVAGKRVLELGAGVGAPGIAAAMAGAKQVVITDREPLSLFTAALSAQASGISARANWEPAAAGGIAGQGGEAQEGGRDCQVVAELLDWSQPVPAHLGRFDLVLATDVLYEHHAVPMLASVVGQLLGSSCGQDAALLLAEYPDRYPANQRNFQTMLQDPPLRLFVESLQQELVPLPTFQNEMLDIEIDPESPAIKTDFLLFRQRSC